MKKLTFALLLALAVAMPSTSLAAYMKAGDNVSLSQSATLKENAYLAGTMVSVSSDIEGDLFAAGSSVSVSGDIEGDLFAAGANVNVVSVSAEDARVAGSNVLINGKFSGELFAAGAQLSIAPETEIGGSAYLAGAVVNFNGIVEGDLILKGVEKLVIGADAEIGGNLEYSSAQEANISADAAIAGEVIFHKMDKPVGKDRPAASAIAGLIAGAAILQFLAVLLFAYLLWYVRRKDMLELIQKGMSQFGMSLLYGFLFVVAVPIAVLVLAFTVIGLPVAIFAGLVYAALLMLAGPATAILVTALIFRKKADLRWYHILAGLVILSIVKLIPFVGCLAAIVLCLAALGALLSVLKAKFRK